MPKINLFKKEFIQTLLEKSILEIEKLNYTEQFLELFPQFFMDHLPLSGLSVFLLSTDNKKFIPYYERKYSGLQLNNIDWNSSLVTYLKNLKKTIIIKNESSARVKFLKKTNPDFFEKLSIDIIIPLFSIKKLYGFIGIKANNKTYKEMEQIEGFFHIFSNILIPRINEERNQIEKNKNYYKIYKMDRLAMVGELAASAAHEIKNPLAGISVFLKYFIELKEFTKEDIFEELNIMRQSVQRIDEIVKSLLSFSRFKKKEIKRISLSQIVESSHQSIMLKIPPNIKILKKMEDDLIIETDIQLLQQVLINILFNAIEAIGNEDGDIKIHNYVTGRDQLPSKELFHISIKDTGPGIDETLKDKLFQPFQTTKEEGTGLGLYTCYGLMKSLGGSIDLCSNNKGTEVILSLPYSFDDDLEG